jgi:hypothetical protein
MKLAAVLLSVSGVDAGDFQKLDMTLHDPVRERDIPTLVWKPSSGGGYPLVLLNHGAGTKAEGAAGNYDYMAEALADQGYVVAAFNECDTGCTQEDYMMDIAAVRDVMRSKSQDSSDDFAGLLGQGAIGVGHSLGGGTQFVAADIEVMRNCNNHSPCNGGYSADIDGLVGMAAGFDFSGDPVVPVPADTPDPFVSAPRLEIPALFLSGKNDCMVKSLHEPYPAYVSMTKSPCRIFTNITGADHCQFEAQGALAYAGCTGIELFMGCGPAISQTQQQAISVKYTLMFADYVLKGDQSAITSLKSTLQSDATDGTLEFEFEGCESQVSV